MKTTEFYNHTREITEIGDGFFKVVIDDNTRTCKTGIILEVGETVHFTGQSVSMGSILIFDLYKKAI